MKKILILLMIVALLAGCTADPSTSASTQPSTSASTDAASSEPNVDASSEPTAEPSLEPIEYAELVDASADGIKFVSSFDSEVEIVLSDSGVSSSSDAVFTSNDIIYYEDKDYYDSGYPYGEGEAHERHSADEAAAHTVVNITEPGRYRVSGTLSAGQIRVDLGEEAYSDPNARVELILDNADITCTVAPAVLFLNVYECDGEWSTDTARSDVDTSDAGATLVLEGENYVDGSHVARIYKDKEGEKKLWKMDGAVYSYMSLNVFGPGSLDLTADNEGLDTELHLTINGGDIAIRADNDGINTNEDGVSVTTINGGSLHIIAGLGAEGDGIDSNGYLVINGGVVVSSAHPAADAGLDSDLGSFINGGTVIALGSTMDWAESDSEQVTMNLQFASQQSSGSAVVVTRPDGTIIFAYDPSEDEVLGENTRRYQGAVVSSPNFAVGESYYVYLDGVVSGSDEGGIYAVSTISGYDGGVRQAYTGSDLSGFGGGFPGGFGGGFGGGGRGDFNGEIPEDFDPSQGFGGEMPNGEAPEMPEGFDGELPEGFDPNAEGFGGGRGDFNGELPEGFDGELPEDFDPNVEGFGGGRGDFGGGSDASADGASILFYMQDKVNAFSGITAE